jgi:hypothetical protein
MNAFPLTPESWTVLLAVGLALAGLGWEYRRRPVYQGPHWTNDVAHAVMVTGRITFFVAVLLFVGGGVQGGLHP